jgi:hypothetical protein
MPRLCKSNLEQTRTSLLCGLDALGDYSHWPFTASGDQAVSLVLKAERDRRQTVEDALTHWLVTGDFGKLDDVSRFLLRARFWWGRLVVDSLLSLPVYTRGGSLIDGGWVLIRSWETIGLERWKADLEANAYWYEKGKDDGERPSFAV